jgi:thiol-disulfide isomerase/thioredoxin
MNTKTKTILLSLVLVVILGGAYLAYSALSENYVPNTMQNTSTPTSSRSSSDTTEKSTAPDFMVYDASGNPVKLSDFFGKPIVLNFWASWCPPCKSEMPHFNKAYTENKDDIVFLMVDLVDGQRETQAKGQKYIEEQGYTFPVYYDSKQQAAVVYDVIYLPTTVLINADGSILKQYQGAISQKTLEAGIQALLGQE